MNFTAFEHWTDGWRVDSLMPNDEGLRRCKCGQFVLVRELVAIETAESSDLARIDRVPAELLPECIAKPRSEEVEVAARLEYWRHLNHPYRERYRQHRDAEERTWWDKLRGVKVPSYSRSPGAPFTFPAFQATDEQLQNMKRLSQILHARGTAARDGNILVLAELYREQGRFEEAELVISTIAEQDVDVTSKLIAGLIKDKKSAPVRYRM